MRLTRTRDISRVFRSGISVHNPYLIVRARKRGDSPARLGFALARKHVHSAVLRNRAKRIVRESFRKHARLLRGYDVVVVSRPGLAAVDRRELRGEVDRQWARLVSEGAAEGRKGTARGRRAGPTDG